MVTVSLLGQPLLHCSQFALTPFVIPVHHFAAKDSPNTHGQSSVQQYLKQINLIFPVPHHLSFHRDLRDALCLGLWHSGQTLILCERSHLPSLQKKQTGQFPTPLGMLAFCTKAVILPRL